MTRTKGPLRVAFNALNLPASLAGIGFYSRSLLEALSALPRMGELVLFTNAAAADSFRALGPIPSKVRVVGLPAGSIAAKVAQSQLGLPPRLRGFDLLHSVGNVACLPTRIPQVVTVHDLCHRVVPGRFGPVKRAYLEWGIRLTARRDMAILCVSENTRRDLLRFYPEAAGKAQTVHSGCKFPVDRGEAGLRSGFLFVGTLEPGKNLDVALKALARVRAAGRPANLRVIGAKGWRQGGIPGLLRELSLEGAVEFLGYQDDAALRRAYKTSLALVFPSAYEGFGFPLLEAQSQGCPVISADNSCLREVGGDGCRYFRDGDLDGLAALMADCMDTVDGDALAGRRELGFANCGRFSWERAARETLAVYEAALARA